jgi:hypothetical protein
VASNKHIVNGLKDLTSILSFEQYRVFGSLIPLSLEASYRKIGDIDVFVDGSCQDKVSKHFSSKGYIALPGRPGIAEDKTISFKRHATCIQMEFGKLDRSGWRMDLRLGFSLFLPRKIWSEASIYEFKGVKYAGVEPSFALYMLNLMEKTKFHPEKGKREKDLEILQRRFVGKKDFGKAGVWFRSVYIPTRLLFALIVLVTPFLAKEGEKTKIQRIREFKENCLQTS